MVLTNTQTTAFFSNANQMVIPATMVIQLTNEGIITVGDLVDVDKYALQQNADNHRHPGGRVADPSADAMAGG